MTRSSESLRIVSFFIHISEILLTFSTVSKEAALREPKITTPNLGEIDGEHDEDSEVRSARHNLEVKVNGNEDISFSSFPLSMKPLCVMTKWRHSKTSDGRLAVFVVLPTGTIDRTDGVKAEFVSAEKLQLSFSWSPALLDANGLMQAIFSYSEELRDGQRPLMAPGLRDYADPLHADSSKEVASTCIVQLPFPVKSNFEEDLIKFDRSDTTTIYVLRFQGFENKFATTKKKLVVRNIKLNNENHPVSIVMVEKTAVSNFIKIMKTVVYLLNHGTQHYP